MYPPREPEGITGWVLTGDTIREVVVNKSATREGKWFGGLSANRTRARGATQRDSLTGTRQ